VASEPDPIKNDRRRNRRSRKLPPDAACLLCGKTTPEALLLAKRSLLESHHVVAEANDPDLEVPLCRDCHAEITEGMLSAGVDHRHERVRTVPEVLVSIFRALASFFRALADACDKWAGQLLELISALDDHDPCWRELPGAQW
jgi:hypothetical protein